MRVSVSSGLQSLCVSVAEGGLSSECFETGTAASPAPSLESDKLLITLADSELLLSGVGA